MRVRFRFTKLGKVRFTSHRDVARIWERALRRAALPVATTEGFSPRLKVHFGLAAPTAYESLGEYLDIDFTGPMDVRELPALLTPLLPVGIDVHGAEVVSTRGVSLQQAVTSCTWDIEVPALDRAALEAEVARILAADELVITRERKGQPVTDDIRPGILGLEVQSASDPGLGGVLRAELATQPRGLRPAELLAAFDPPQDEGRVRRIAQWITDGSEPREPLASPLEGAPVGPLAAEPTHAELRAS